MAEEFVCPECSITVYESVSECPQCGASLLELVEDTSDKTIRKELSRLNRMSFVFGVPGLALQFYGYSQSPMGPGRSVMDGPGAPWIVMGTILLIIGLCIYARMKGRNAAWGLVGILSIIGLIILGLLGKQCRKCQRLVSYKETKCPFCTGPI